MRNQCGILAATVLVVSGGLALAEDAATKPATKLPFTISKETTAITTPLRADGSVDYIAALNEKYGKGVTPQNNGFVVWLKMAGTGEKELPPSIQKQVLKMCGATEGEAGAEVWSGYEDFVGKEAGLTGSDLEKASEEIDSCRMGLWEEKDHPRVAAFLKKREKLLALAAEAAERPRWWTPYVSSDGRTMVAVGIVPFRGFFEVATALCARAMLRAKGGDFAGFMSDMATVKKLAGLISGPFLEERLTGSGLNRMADETVASAAGSGVFSADECVTLEKMLDAFPRMPEIWEVVDEGERWAALDSVAVVAMGIGGRAGENARGNIPANLEWKSIDCDVVLRRVNELREGDVKVIKVKGVSEMLAAMEAENLRNIHRVKYGPGNPRQDGESVAAYSTRAANVVAVAMTTSYAGAERIHREAELERAMARTVVALALMKAKTGKWPAHLRELVPNYLEQIPRDIYSEGEQFDVIYDKTENGVRVYSVGRNGVDDGGVMDREKKMDDIAVGVVEK